MNTAARTTSIVSLSPGMGPYGIVSGVAMWQGGGGFDVEVGLYMSHIYVK